MNYYPYLPFASHPFAESFQSHPHLQVNGQGFTMPTPLMESAQNDDGTRPWAEWEDQRLKAAADKFNGKGWRKICLSAFPDGSRTKEECLKRWRQLTKSVSVKGLWTAEEDSKLTSFVKEMGAEKWVAIASRLGTRTGKQCRERWHNHLDPRINKSPFTPEEEQLIFHLHGKIGSKWAEMSKHLPGRSDNSIKNFFNTAMQRKRKLQQINNGTKGDLKRHKDDQFNWSPQAAKNFLSQHYSGHTLGSDLSHPFSQLNMRVLTPPDTPQPGLNLSNGFDMYSNQWNNFQQKSNYLSNILHPSKLEMLNMTPLTDSSPALPQGTFERAVFDHTKDNSSNPVTPSNFGSSFYSHQPAVGISDFENSMEIKQENSFDSSMPQTSAPTGYHLGLVGVGYGGMADNDVQDYLFMSQ